MAVERLLLPFLVLVRGGDRPCGVCHGARAVRKERGLPFSTRRSPPKGGAATKREVRRIRAGGITDTAGTERRAQGIKGAHHADEATLGIGQPTEHRLHGHLQVDESR